MSRGGSGVFDAGKLAKQALQRAEETRKKTRHNRQRTAILTGAFAVCFGLFFFVFASSMLQALKFSAAGR